MHRHRSLSRQKLSMKTFLEKIIPKKSSKSDELVHESVVEEHAQNHSSSNMVCCSSSTTTLKRNEELVKKDQGTSPDPTLTNQQSEQVRKPFRYTIDLVRLSDNFVWFISGS
jgi:hypothetical protein